MNATLNAVRLGSSRGLIEFKLSFRSGQELFGYLYMPVLFLGLAITFNNMGMKDDVGHPIGSVILSGGIASFLGICGVTTVMQVLATEREDGTLLRAKGVPRGLLGYGIAKIVYVVAMSTTALLIMVLPGLLFVDGFGFQGWADVVTLLWVSVLGMFALAPLGAILGSLVQNPRMGVGLSVLPTVAVSMFSGLLFPFEFMPGWVQTIGQVLPVYWLGLGTRAAMLPDSYAALELAGSWQLPLVAGVLTVWSLVGFLIAQRVLRRMARRQSGSRVQAAREESMKRAY